MSDYVYSGLAYFEFNTDTISFREFQLIADEDRYALAFDLFQNKAVGFSYQGFAKAYGQTYLTERFTPYEDSGKVEVQLKLTQVLFLVDQRRRPFLYLVGCWYEGEEKYEYPFFGLLHDRLISSEASDSRSNSSLDLTHSGSSMDGLEYHGYMSFSGYPDTVEFLVRFDTQSDRVHYKFQCKKSRSGPYEHEGYATSSERGRAYISARLTPYSDWTDRSVYLHFFVEKFKPLSDGAGTRCLHLEVSWKQATTPMRRLHGLLRGRGSERRVEVDKDVGNSLWG